MDAEDLPVISPAIDLAQVPAINHKRTLAFLNHFVAHTVRFLNRFSCVCEEKLAVLHTKIQRIEITLNLLEAKLASIPGLDSVNGISSITIEDKKVKPETPSVTPLTPEVLQIQPVVETAASDLKVSDDPRYAKYFKMKNFGVPEQAIKMKMIAEGLDPNLLGEPDAAAPPGAFQESESDDSSSQASSFTDED